MASSAGYSVKFGVEAWTIQYEDATSGCIVTFDADIDSLDSSTGPQTLVLNPGVICANGKAQEQVVDVDRAALVMQRVQSYLEAAGFVVKRWSG
jgi:hypothetical protein